MRKFILSVAFYLGAFPIIAQTERQLTVSEIRQQTVVDEPITLQKGYYRIFSGMYYYFLSIEQFDNNWKKQTISDNYQTNSFFYPLTLRYGLTNKLEMDVLTAYYNTVSSYSATLVDYGSLGQPITDKGKTIKRGFADLSIYAIYKLLDEKGNMPSLALSVNLRVPYGKKSPTISDDSKTTFRPTTAGNYLLGAGYLLKKVFYPFVIINGFSYGYNFPSDVKIGYNDSEMTHVKQGNYFNFYFELYYVPNDWVNFRNYFGSAAFGKSEYSNIKYKSMEISTADISWETEINFQIKNLKLSQGLSFTLIGKNTPSTPSYFTRVEIKI